MRPSLALVCAAVLVPATAWLWSENASFSAADRATSPADGTAGFSGPSTGRLEAPEGLNPDARASVEVTETSATTRVVDLCGLGRLSVTAEADADANGATLDDLPAPIGKTPLAQAKARWLDALRRGSADARVAALLLDKPVVNDDDAKRLWAEALLREAYASQNATALSWAEEACAQLPDDSACRLGLVRARLRADPTNAVHWVALADQDPTATEEAWIGLLAAKRWSESPQALASVTEAALPADVPAYLRQALSAQVRDRAGTLPAHGESFVQERCQAPDAERKQECDQLVRTLLEQGDSLHTLSQAGQLAQATGWTTKQLNEIDQELQALSSVEARAAPNRRQAWSCASVEASSRYLADVAQVGELGALRARREASVHGLR